MKSHRILSWGFVLATLYAGWAQAADVEAGKAKAAMCQSCHGSAGISSNGQFPNLAGQMPTYLASQLNGFKSGTRDNAMMKGIAVGLSDADVANLAAYFASLPPAKLSGIDAALANAGKDKAGMCLGCHGNTAQGQGGFPRLAGQQPEYLVKQLKDFRKGLRRGGPMGAMAGTLSDQAISEIAAYLGSL